MIALADNGIQAHGAEVVDLLQPCHIPRGHGIIQFKFVYALLRCSGVFVAVRRNSERLIRGDAQRLHNGDGIIQLWIALTGLDLTDGGIGDAGKLGQFLVGHTGGGFCVADKLRELLDIRCDVLNL